MITRMVSCTVLVALAASSAQPVIAKDPTSTSEETEAAQALVRAALEAEINDDAALRESFLRRALKKAPDFAPARWHSGYVREGDEWLKYDEVWQRAYGDKLIGLYGQMRSRANSAADHLALARWCRKVKLGERAQLHWMYVLAQDPVNKEARQALGLREFRRMLMTEEQIAEFENERKKVEESTLRWTAIIEPLREEMLGDDVEARERARARLRKIEDATAVPAVMKALFTPDRELAFVAVEVLGSIATPEATAALARLALYSKHRQVRVAAAKQLKDRPLHEFVPGLLSLLNTPVSLRYYVSTFAGGSQVAYSLEQEGPEAHLVSTTLSRASFFSRRLPSNSPIRSYFHTNHVARSLNRMPTRQVERHNQQTKQTNERVYAVLVLATGKELKNEPQAWWEWWAKYNELYTPNYKPVYRTTQSRYYQLSMSCFVAGTKVLTETGPRPIETIRIGDRVLSQDCETGELAYKIVMQTTLRPPSKTLRVEVGGEEIWTTLGHPFWVTDQGWRMAKQLGQGSLLHAVTGPQLVDTINQGPEASAHNLVVADFKTYFVGQSNVLVHDNQPRNPTRVRLPGMATK